MKEWYRRSEIVAAGAGVLPSDLGAFARYVEERGWHSDPARFRKAAGRGGGTEYHLSLIPAEVQARLLAAAVTDLPQSRDEARSHELWRRFDALPERQKGIARCRLAAIDRVALLCAGMTRQLAVALVAREAEVSTSTIWGWLRMADAVARPDRLAALVPQHRGRTVTAECDVRAWTFLVGDYLRPERPSFDAAYRRMLIAATEQGCA